MIDDEVELDGYLLLNKCRIVCFTDVEIASHAVLATVLPTKIMLPPDSDTTPLLKHYFII